MDLGFDMLFDVGKEFDDYLGNFKLPSNKELMEDTRKAKIKRSLSGRITGPPSKETRAKISVGNKGNTHSSESKAKMRGRKHTKETRAKISVGNKGKEHSSESKAKMSKSAKKRPVVSAETKAKMSKSAKLRKHQIIKENCE